MSNYHISPKTGRPNLCRAKNACPFGVETPHFESKQDAKDYIAKKAASENPTVPKAARKTSSKTPAKPTPMAFAGPGPVSQKVTEGSVYHATLCSECGDRTTAEDGYSNCCYKPLDYARFKHGDIYEMEFANQAELDTFTKVNKGRIGPYFTQGLNLQFNAPAPKRIS